jgi:transcriptional regulator with XRE-family HTH domain
LLRQLRDETQLTKKELAEAARLSPPSISDLERGINRTARKDTTLLLAGALGLAWPGRCSSEYAGWRESEMAGHHASYGRRS